MVPATFTSNLLKGTVIFIFPGAAALPASLPSVAPATAVDSELVPGFSRAKTRSILGSRTNLVVTNASTGMTATTTSNGSQGFNPPAAGGGGPPPASFAPRGDSSVGLIGITAQMV